MVHFAESILSVRPRLRPVPSRPGTVGQATPLTSLPMLHVPGQTFRPILPAPVYYPEGRTVRHSILGSFCFYMTWLTRS
jgi:hypothetical protein